MSLVGTRPILQEELRQYELHHRARIAIKPGITGMWQVSGRSDITDFEEVVRLDTEYIYDIIIEYWVFSIAARLHSLNGEKCVNPILRKIYVEKQLIKYVKEEELNKKLVCELFCSSTVAPDSFWDLLRTPEEYKDELDFYKKENLPEGYVDLPTVVKTISDMVRELPFWCAMVELMNKISSENDSNTKPPYSQPQMRFNSPKPPFFEYVAILECYFLRIIAIGIGQSPRSGRMHGQVAAYVMLCCGLFIFYDDSFFC